MGTFARIIVELLKALFGWLGRKKESDVAVDAKTAPISLRDYAAGRVLRDPVPARRPDSAGGVGGREAE